MAKRKFIKSIQKSSPFKKLSVTFISLALLFVISILLYFVFNKYSIENFTPKANARIEVMLWTDDEGSVNNKFVTDPDQWLHIVASNDKFATFGKGNFAGFKNYIKNGFKGTDKEAEVTNANFDAQIEQLKAVLPLVSVNLIVDNKIDGDFGLFTCDTTQTGTYIKSLIGKYSTKDYDKLYSNSTSSTPSTPSAPPPKNTPLKSN